jgi:hypothetical protein
MFTLTALPVLANHSSSISPLKICTSSAVFKGSATTTDSLRLTMTAQVFDSSLNLIASGSQSSYKSVGDEVTFTVDYPDGTFEVGETVIISITDIPGTTNGTQGAADIAKVGAETDCLAGPLAENLLDGRINNSQSHDVAAPVAVYCVDGNIDVYKIDPKTSDGTRIISVPQADGSPADGTQLLSAAQGVSLYWLDTGEYQINTTNFEGLPYWINWVACNANTLKHLSP